MGGHLKRIWAERARRREPELIDYLFGCQGLSASQRAGWGGGGGHIGLRRQRRRKNGCLAPQMSPHSTKVLSCSINALCGIQVLLKRSATSHLGPICQPLNAPPSPSSYSSHGMEIRARSFPPQDCVYFPSLMDGMDFFIERFY